MNTKKLYLIDATAFCYRAFYALPELSTSFGQPTGAIYGFVNILNKILKSENPDYLAVCFDVSRDTFRQKKFAEYKIQRPAMPDSLSSQIPIIKEIVAAYGIAIFEKTGYEADDIIATITALARGLGLSITIVSYDKDILQLVDDFTVVFSPQKDKGVVYTAKEVKQRFGVTPPKIPEIIALAGDSADNIPGVPGIGEKTAAGLINEFGSLGELLKNIERLKPRTKKAILDNMGQLTLSNELARLDKEVDIDFDLDKLKIAKPNLKELHGLFKRLEFRRLLTGLAPEEGKRPPVSLIALEDSELGAIAGSEFDLAVCGNTLDELVFNIKDKFYRLNSSGENLKAVLGSPRIKKISHDLKKIKVSLAKNEITLQGLYFDTMIAAYLLNPSKPEYSLASVAGDYLGWSGGQDFAPAQAADLILKLKPVLEKQLQEKELIRLFYDIEMPLVSVLAEMELNGIKLDLGVIDNLSQKIEKKLIKLIEDIYDLSACQFNINSPKQLRQVLFEKLKLPVVKKTKTGPSTDEEVLRALADKHSLPALLLEYRQLMKLKTTYVDVLPGLVDEKTARIHTTFNQTGTETGRISSSNPNLQNIPVKTGLASNIRLAIVASAQDCLLVSCDYSQIELRVLAHLSGDNNLVLAFKENKDIHKATACLIYGLDEQGVSPPMREAAKRVNFGIVYGLSAYGLSRDLGIPVDQAQGFIDAYFVRFPGVKEYIRKQIEKAKDSGFVTTISGRRRYLPEINSKNQSIRQFAERKAVNTPIQGSAADLIKLAMIQIHSQMRVGRLSAKMILQVHDELVFDCPKKELKELTGLVKFKMENVLKLDVPVRVDVKIGNNWLEMEEVK